jgi:hypothetical protein
MDQVGAFTRLAEEKRIKVIVPPISSASTEERTRVYDYSSSIPCSKDNISARA